MDALLICRDGTEDSVVGNVALAKACREAGHEAAVLFTAEALAALGRGPFAWSGLFAGRDARMAISRNAEAQGLPLAAERDSRWTDVRRFLQKSAEDGVVLWACPIWSGLLALAEPPGGLRQISKEELVEALASAKIIVGGY